MTSTQIHHPSCATEIDPCCRCTCDREHAWDMRFIGTSASNSSRFFTRYEGKVWRVSPGFIHGKAELHLESISRPGEGVVADIRDCTKVSQEEADGCSDYLKTK